MPERARSLAVAITGASGIPYAVRFLERALPHFEPLHLVISTHAFRVVQAELGLDLSPRDFTPEQLLPGNPEAGRIRYWRSSEIGAPLASGSNAPEAMVIVPCSMGTVGRLAAGTSDNLVLRAADVMLKERRKLILVPRETPLSLIHLRNLTALTEAGAIVLPAAPGFYHRPTTIDELLDFIAFRLLDHLGVRDAAAKRWGEE